MYSSPDGEAFSKKEFSLLLAEVTVKKKKKVLQQNGKTWFQLLTIRNCPSPERGPVQSIFAPSQHGFGGLYSLIC